jgi:hypothetical protein
MIMLLIATAVLAGAWIAVNVRRAYRDQDGLRARQQEYAKRDHGPMHHDNPDWDSGRPPWSV